MRVFWIASSVAFALASAYHAGLAASALAVRADLAFHSAFAVVDALFAIGLLLRPPWLAIAFACLAAQQIWSHGSQALAAWTAGGVDYLSWLIVVMMPVWLIALVADRNASVR